MKKLNKKRSRVSNSIEAYWTCYCTNCGCVISSSNYDKSGAGAREGMVLFGGDDWGLA